jgi:hypothetical protein
VAQASFPTNKCDIFVSYSSKDRPWVEPFAKLLASIGWSVWWDRHIPTGQSFDSVIEQHLTTARCVIVVWSQSSVTSDWVKTEAAVAKERKVLLPVLIDDAKLPLEFNRVQTQFLKDWRGGSPHRGFDQLTEDIARLLDSPPSETCRAIKSRWARIHPLWLLSLPTVVVTMIVIILMQWPISTRIKVELTTERVEFAVNAPTARDQAMLGPLSARALGIEKFRTISFEPETMEVADPAQYDIDKDDFPAPAWEPLTLANAKVLIEAKESTRHPRVTIEGPNRNGLPAIQLGSIPVSRESHVTLEMRGGKVSGLTIKVTGQQNVNLPIRDPVKLTIQHAEVHGLVEAAFLHQEELTYRFRLPDRAAWIEIVTQPSGLVISPTFSPGQLGTPIFRGIPTASLDFTRQARAGERADMPVGERVSALTANGEITFPDYPHLGTISLSKDEAIGLEQLDWFTIKQISLSADAAGMHMTGEGMVSQIRTKTGHIPIQYHLSAFDKLKHHRQLAVLLAIVAWAFPTTLGAYRLWKEVKW